MRITDRRFAAVARYLSDVAPSTFATPIEFRAKSHYISLQTWTSGGYKKCDVVSGGLLVARACVTGNGRAASARRLSIARHNGHRERAHLRPQVVIPSNDILYLQPSVQARLKTYVQDGKGLLVVGPNVMPSFYYDPTAAPLPRPPPSLGQSPASTPSPTPPPPPKRRGRSAQADRDGQLASASDAAGHAPTMAAELEAGVTGEQPLRRALAAGTGGPVASFNSSEVLVNVITTPVGIVFSGFVSDPVRLGALGSPPPSPLHRLAA